MFGTTSTAIERDDLFSALIKKADEAFAQFDASGDDELDYKVPSLLLIFRLQFKIKTLDIFDIFCIFHPLGVLRDDSQEAARRCLNSFKVVSL